MRALDKALSEIELSDIDNPFLTDQQMINLLDLWEADIRKRAKKIDTEHDELMRLKKRARGAHKWHESRVRAEDDFQDFFKIYNKKAVSLNREIALHNYIATTPGIPQ
tara:strand:+ start:32241 stop:32564 length:324 start_codon:yes stop_codon:yes gene_type:complete